MTLTIKNSGPLVAQDEINTIEIALGHRLVVVCGLGIGASDLLHLRPRHSEGVA